MLIARYASKKDCAAAIGTQFKYIETSLFGDEYVANGTMTVANRPHITRIGREWFGNVTVKDGIIVKVK